jgi:polysaccharide biosynthesis transport protein
MYRRNHIAYRLLDAFFRSWALFSLVFVSTAGIVTGALMMRGNTHVASAVIRVVPENEVSEVMGFQQRNWVNPSDQSVARFNDLMRNMLPGGFVDKALQGAQLVRPIQMDATEKDTRFGALRKAIYAAATSNDVFTIGIVWDDPDEAERIVNSLQARFIEDAGMTRQLSSERVTAYLDTEIAGVEARMRQAERAVIEFKRAHQGQLPTAQASIIAQLQTLEEERSLLYATREDYSTKRQAVEERLRYVSPTSILSQTRRMETPLGVEILALQRKRREMVLADAYKSDLAEVDAEIERLRQQEQAMRLRSGGVAETQYQDNPEYRDLQMQLTGLKGEERARIARTTHLNEQIAKLQAEVARFPAAERVLNEKTRTYESLRDFLKDLLKRREQAQQRSHIARINATTSLIPMSKVVSEPTMGMKKKVMTLGIGIGLGLFLGLLLIVLREWADPTLRYEADTERLLGASVLASLPEERTLGRAA